MAEPVKIDEKPAPKMGARRCRIGVSAGAVVALLIAIALTIAAISTPEWQVAAMDQVNQVRYIGLYQTCAYGSRQGPGGLPRWICTFIPYGQGWGPNQFNFGAGLGAMQPAVGVPRANEVDYNASGGESWRLTTLILLVIAAFFGFLSFVFEVVEICLDTTRTITCLKAMSGLSLITLILATLCAMIGVLTFAVESQQNHNLYVLELTAFAIFQLGQSFYIGIAAVVMFLIALGIDIGGTALICITANPRSKTPRERFYYTEIKTQPEKRLFVATDSETLPVKQGNGNMMIIQNGESGFESGLNSSLAITDDDDIMWKYPKMTRV